MKKLKKQPLYGDSGKVVATVEGQELYKRIQAKHFLRKPPAIAFDLSVIRQAEELGATHIRVVDTTSRSVYRVTMKKFRAIGFPVNRGYGAQMGLTLPHWTESRPDESTPTQLSLF